MGSSCLEARLRLRCPLQRAQARLQLLCSFAFVVLELGAALCSCFAFAVLELVPPSTVPFFYFAVSELELLFMTLGVAATRPGSR